MLHAPPNAIHPPRTLQRDERRELLPLRERLFARPLVRLGAPSGSSSRKLVPLNLAEGDLRAEGEKHVMM